MFKLKVVTLAGDTRILDARVGATLMEIVRDGGVDDLLAMCGGNCACGTCHVYVDTAASSHLREIMPAEDDLLNGSNFRRDSSRLLCQIEFKEELDGMTVTMAPRD